MKYQRLADKMKELVDIRRKVEDDTEYIQEHLSLCTVFECFITGISEDINCRNMRKIINPLKHSFYTKLT
jgi:hypothetical protein